MNHKPIEIKLIEGWSAHDEPQIKTIDMTSTSGERRFLSSYLFDKYLTGAAPACGNLHAGQGRMRMVVEEAGEDVVHECADDDELQGMLHKVMPRLGSRVLVSAGHYMPEKRSGFKEVNPNSLMSLEDGLTYIQRLIQVGIKADLMVTINDVTINDTAGIDNVIRATLTSEERVDFYRTFALPISYVKSIERCWQDCAHQFEIYVVGENKLAERLSKVKNRLINGGRLKSCKGGYSLTFDLSGIDAIAHGNEKTASTSDVFISAQRGVTGRPKCVRACALLAAVPYQLGYTGYVQFLPICARNALEGFLIGKRLFQSVPYVSVHKTRSCF